MNKKIALISFSLLCLCASGIIFVAIVFDRRDIAKVAFLDVGQGDAIYIESPHGIQVMIDGGGGPQVLKELGAQIPFFDRSIDMLIVSNPDKDHIGGFVDVLQRYKVSFVVEPGTIAHTQTYKAMQSLIQEKVENHIIGKGGMRIMLDSEAQMYIDVLFPDRDVSQEKTNDGSLVAKLVYKNNSILFQGDAPSHVERYLLAQRPGDLDSDILKVGHHGSKTSTVPEYVEMVSPQYAIISSGRGNSYGHPHQQVLDTLKDQNNIVTLRTDTEGVIVFESDGDTLIRVD